MKQQSLHKRVVRKRAARQVTKPLPPAQQLDASVELHALPNLCCTSGACRTVRYWSVDYPQEGLLRLDDAVVAIPVQLFAFSTRGVGVVTRADVTIEHGAQAMLITHAHGAGCNYRSVQCCWHRPHPQDEHLQCIGLRFAIDNDPDEAQQQD